MDYIVNGGNKLYGELPIYGAKNCALACLGASLLTEGQVTLVGVPQIVDVDNMLRLLTAMGKKVVRFGDVVAVSGGVTSTAVSAECAHLLRGSALVLGSALGCYGNVALPLPGGCAIGARPMDIHCDGLRAMGVSVCDCGDLLTAEGRPRGVDYSLRFASVGATENLLCAAVLGDGTFVLRNCATEPEVTALAKLLVAMGAKIGGVGRSSLTVTGVAELHGATMRIIPDRIVAATYLAAVCACGGKLLLTHYPSEYMTAFETAACKNAGIKRFDDAAEVTVKRRVKSVGHIVTAPYPAFHTDMQSLALTLAATAKGKSVICEKLFENRLRHNAGQLACMGADIRVSGDTAFVSGTKLHGAEVICADLRGGAALTVAALCAEGCSTVSDIMHIDRGYVALDKCLHSVGADIRRK